MNNMNDYKESLNNIRPSQDDEAFTRSVLRRAEGAGYRQSFFTMRTAPLILTLAILIGGSTAAYLKFGADSMSAPLAAEEWPAVYRADVAAVDMGPLVYEIDIQLIYPINGNYGITEQTQWSGGYAGHNGIDINAPRGTEILAAQDGEVTFADWNAGYGRTVIIDHGERTNIEGQRITTLYAHCDELFVEVGDVVEQGQVIATVGDSGQAYGTHLHFEMGRSDGDYFDPIRFLPKPEPGESVIFYDGGTVDDFLIIDGPVAAMTEAPVMPEVIATAVMVEVNEPPVDEAAETDVDMPDEVSLIGPDWVFGVPNFMEGFDERDLYYTNGDEIWVWIPTGYDYDVTIELIDNESGQAVDSFGVTSTANAPKGQYNAGLLKAEPGRVYWLRATGECEDGVRANIADRAPKDN